MVVISRFMCVCVCTLQFEVLSFFAFVVCCPSVRRPVRRVVSPCCIIAAPRKLATYRRLLGMGAREWARGGFLVSFFLMMVFVRVS